MRYCGEVIERVKLSTGPFRKFLRARRIAIRDCEKAYCRMSGSHDGTQRADAARTDDCNPELPPIHD